jgi:hypothetical protein
VSWGGCHQCHDKIEIHNRNTKEIYMFDFNLFWNKYPKKVGKRNCEKIYTKIVTSKEVEQSLLKGLDSYIEKWRVEHTDIKYIPNPSTWLNQARWEDDVVISNEQFNKNARAFEREMAQVKYAEKLSYQNSLVDDGRGGFVKLSELIK